MAIGKPVLPAKWITEFKSFGEEDALAAAFIKPGNPSRISIYHKVNDSNLTFDLPG